MAPETGMQGYGSTADVWSIGAVLFEMATGDVHVHNNGVSM
jgi:serine/threonine protein kinase